MPLRVVDGKLLVVGSTLVTNDDCCCDDPGPSCPCTTPILINSCNCVDQNYGTIKTQGNATFTLSGSGIPRPIFDNSGTQICEAGTCPDISGTFVVPCGSLPQEYCITSDKICTHNGLDYYYWMSVLINYTPSSSSFRLQSTLLSAFSPSSSPYPTLTSGCQVSIGTTAQTRDWFWSHPTGFFVVDSYETFDCERGVCQFPQSIAGCVAGSAITPSSVTPPGTELRNICEITGYTVALSIAPAS